LSDQDKRIALNAVLNQHPPVSWLKKNNGIEYLPISKVRYMLTRLYVDWFQEIKSVMIVANSITVTVTLHYVDLIDSTWKRTDGIGAAPINTKSGKGAMEWDHVTHDSVQKAAPAAASYALKNAVKRLGRIFGAELKGEDIDYSTLIDEDKFKNAKIIER
jgi:hypothetical protein